MTTTDVVRVFALIQRLFPRDNTFNNVGKEELIKRAEAWAEILSDVSMEDAEEAVKRHARTSAFPPAICDITEHVEAKRKNAIYHARTQREERTDGPGLQDWLKSREFNEKNKELLRKAMQIMK